MPYLSSHTGRRARLRQGAVVGGTEGRALHLLDVEYLGCGPTLSADDLALVLRTYRVRADWHVGDHIFSAANALAT